MTREPAFAAALSTPDRPPAFVRNLARLPAAMLDQILNDLPIVRILQILSFGTEAMKDSVFNNRNYGQLFESPANAAYVLELFLLYRDICWFRRLPLANNWSYLSSIYSFAPQHQAWHYIRSGLKRIESELMAGTVLRELHLPDLDEAILSAHSTKPCPELDQNNLPLLKARWDWIKQTKIGLNAAKAEQINKVAEIVANYPGRLRLKKPLDPSQDGPRPNTEHIVNGLRGAAKRVVKDRHINHYYRVRCCKAVEHIEVIPYDKYLWLFLDTIKQYPPRDEGNDAELLEKLTLLDRSTGTTFKYPDDISTAISSVKKGLVNVYTGSPLLLVPRIDWGFPIIGSSDPSKPTFFVETRYHPYDLPDTLHRCVARKVMTYDDREYEWLGAFLKVVTWMEDNLSLADEAVTGL